MYVEKVFGYADALKYINGYRGKVSNRRPIITQKGSHREPPGDQYFKGALFLHTLRNVLGDDDKWWALVREVYDTFKYQSIETDDILKLFNKRFGRDLQPVFDQYLRHAQLPLLELIFDDAKDSVSYRWKTDVPGFDMPIRVGERAAWQQISPTTEWQTLSTELGQERFEVATDLYYVKVTQQPRESD
jgi:hypothetical protein